MRVRRPFLIVAAICLSLTAFACSQTATNELEAKLDRFLAPLVEKNLYSGTVLVAKGGEVLLAKGYGLADREHGVPCGPETKYRLGSLTKQFTAMLVNGDKITVHNLLTHTSGVPNFTSFPDYADTMMIPASLEELIARFKDKPLDFQPGEKFSYSNSGYILLSYIVEKTGGKRIEELLREMTAVPGRCTPRWVTC